MKILNIFVSFAFSVIVKGTLLGAAVRGIEPIILSLGAAFTAFGIDSQPRHDINHYKWDWNFVCELLKEFWNAPSD